MAESYFITYRSERYAEKIETSIKKCANGFAKLTDNTWVIKSDQSVTQIRDELAKSKGKGDTIYVIRSGTLAAWVTGSDKISDWLKNNL